MKKKDVFMAQILCVSMLLVACTGKDESESVSIFETTDNAIQQEVTEHSIEQKTDETRTDDIIMNDDSDAFYDALDVFNGEYTYTDSSDGLSGTLYIIQELDYSREYSIYDSNSNGFRFIALGSNIEYIKDNRFYLKYPEMVYEDDTAVFKYYIVEKNDNAVNLYESDENYESTKKIYTAQKD